MWDDDATAEAVARAVLHDPDAVLLHWETRPIGGGLTAEVGTTAGVSLVAGRAATRGGERPWAAVRKCLRPTEPAWGDRTIPRSEPRGSEYWRREAEAYADGLLDDLGPALRTPRCYASVVRDEGLDLWLEHVVDDSDVWGMVEFAVAAEALGRWAGSSIGDTRGLDRPWLARGRIPEWLELGADGIDAMSSVARVGLVARWLDDETVARTLALWTRRDELMMIRDRLPTVLCHHDATRRNLMLRDGDGQPEVVAIDWQFLGLGRLGDEPAAMVAPTLQFLDVPIVDADRFARTVVDHYTAGLEREGWPGDRELVALGFEASAALLMGLAGAGIWFAALTNGSMSEATVCAIVGHPADAIGRQWNGLQRWLLDRGEHALRRASPG